MARRARVDPNELASADYRYRRGVLPAWDERWHRLPSTTRRALAEVLGQARHLSESARAKLPAQRLTPREREELSALGLVEVTLPPKPGKPPVVSVAPTAVDFMTRLWGLVQFPLLVPQRHPPLERYRYECFHPGGVWGLFERVLRAGGIDRDGGAHRILDSTLIPSRRWPEWALRVINDPLADAVVDCLRDRGPTEPADLPRLLPGRPDPETVRAVLERLRLYFVVFEGLHPDTYAIQVGLLPAVREALLRTEEERQRPPLPAVAPAVLGPLGGPEVNDLRAFLFELATAPARVKKDGTLYSKETPRFTAGLEPFSDALAERLNRDDTARVEIADSWARTMKLVQVRRGDPETVQLTPAGRAWLARSVEEQHAAVYDFLRGPSHDNEYGFYSGDWMFLHSWICAFPGKRPNYYGTVRPEQRQPLRDALYRSFRSLPANAFVRVDDFLAHAAFGPDNPVLLGRSPNEVTVLRAQMPVPPLEETLEEAGRHLLLEVIRERLVPLGALQVGLDDKGKLLIARRPRLDAYFGREPDPEAGAAAPADVTRVLVQPDFTIVVIGLNPAPAAELLPFCERERGGVGQGTLTLRLTREAALRAVDQGLKPKEILDRLQRHASVPVPANVAQEVRGWLDRVRSATLASTPLLRCPDRESADRAATALGRGAERLGDTVLAVTGDLSAGEVRRKLLAQGILLSADGKTGARKKKK